MELATDWLAPYNEILERDWDSFDEIREAFEWEIPDTFNGARYLCDRWADGGDNVALYYEDHTIDETGELTYAELRDVTNQLANYLDDQGVSPGDRIAVNTPQKIETVIAHLAIWKTGAVSVPLSVLFGPDALEYRLSDSSSTICIVDASNLDTYRDVAPACEPLDQTLVVGDAEPEGSERRFWDAFEGYSTDYDPVNTAVSDTMLILYSSGTTGPPKGILQPHRCVIGHLPALATTFFNCELADDDVLWTPSEWAWGASISTMFAALFYGKPIVAHETGESFDPERAFDVIDRYDITIPYFVPSALRMMMQVEDAADRFDLESVRVVPSAGESLGASIREWASETFEARIHELYGLSETFNFIIGDAAHMDPRPGWMGYPLPGHRMAILDPETNDELEGAAEGEIALHRGDPTLFQEYLNKPEKTNNAYSGDWFLTGDLGKRNESGRFKFLGRKDDLIISAGYRIGPEEIEDTLITHEAVADAGVIGIPDDERGEVPKAFIVLEGGFAPSDDLKDEISSYVGENLAAYEYPREIAFIDEMPRTTTGKVRRTSLRTREGIE